MSLFSVGPLHHEVAQTLIIAYKEDTHLLESTLSREGLTSQVLRQAHQPEYQEYSRSYLALLNHRRAWQRASQVDGLTLIVEADFVPVRGMGQIPLPMNPQRVRVGIAWLYTCASQIYSVSEEGYAQGFSTSMVAYLLTPASAIALLDLFDQVTRSPGPFTYNAWDSEIGDFLHKRHFENFIPLRNYGEHGGMPNPEHRQHGLSTTHRADVLYGPLAFMPLYAHPPAAIAPSAPLPLPKLTMAVRCRWRYFCTRLHARIKGLGRLLLGKFLRGKVVKESSVPTWLVWFAIRRQFSPYL